MLKQFMLFQDETVQWADIPHYPSYLISTDGRVYNKNRESLVVPDDRGSVMLYNEFGHKSWAIHVLMGCTFLGNDIDDVFRNRVLFKDGNSSNRNLSNLYIEDTSDLPGEEWKPLTHAANRELKDFYVISNKGRIKSLKHSIKVLNHSKLVDKPYPELMISCRPDDDKYMFATLSCKDGTEVNAQVHRLVAAAFCANSDPKTNVVVNHIDGNPSNNCAENLEWCTQEHNAQHAISTGLRGDWTGRKLRYGCKRLETGEQFVSISDAERAMGRCLGYVTERIDHGKGLTDADGNIWTLEIYERMDQKIHTEGQHCKLSIFPDKEFVSLGEASLALGRWEGYISDALKRGGSITSKSGVEVSVELIGAAPVVGANEAYAEKKAEGLVPERKVRKKSKWEARKPLRHIESGTVYASMSAASKAMGKHAGYLSECIAFDRVPTDTNGVVWTFEPVEDKVKIAYKKNECYFEEFPDNIFANMDQASAFIERNPSYIADMVGQGKPILMKDGKELHFHYVDPDKDAAYLERIAKHSADSSEPKVRTTKFACYFDEMPEKIFSNFSEAASFLGKGSSFIRDRFTKGDKILVDGKEIHLHLVNEDLEKEYQDKLNGMSATKKSDFSRFLKKS